MAWGLSKYLKLWLFAIVAMLWATPAMAEHAGHPTCRAYSDTLVPLENAATQLSWTCQNSAWQDGRAVTWLRFDQMHEEGIPSEFTSRIAVFDNLAIAVLDNEGALTQRSYSIEQARLSKVGPTFSLPLPEADHAINSVIVAIEGAHSVTIASEAQIQTDAVTQAASLSQALLLAMVTGMLLMPLLFDAMFYLVLRERFVLLHAGMTCAMLAYVLTSGGVLSAFVETSVWTLAVAGPLSWAVGMGLSGHFIAAFLEKKALSRGVRRSLTICSWWAIIVPGFCALQLGLTQSFDNRLYFYSFLPIIPFYTFALVSAIMRGSRAARFLGLAWLPVMLASVERLLRGVGLYAAPDSIDQAIFVAIALEVIIVALAVADRFFAIRQERDLARTQARSLEEISERDPLTGLLNRRAIKRRFLALRREGFVTLAILDLDQFKSLNDKYGHVLGDRVLEAVAEALQPDADTLAVRLGGEEFALLLRGEHTIERAEHRREAISRIVAEKVRIDRIVTASMGAVEAPTEAIPKASFNDLYRRADKLLYEAKNAGRNRCISESVRVFKPRKLDRRSEDAA